MILSVLSRVMTLREIPTAHFHTDTAETREGDLTEQKCGRTIGHQEVSIGA
jgi:hypothetical protein